LPRPRLLALATGVPPFRLEQTDVADFARDLFAGSYADVERLMPVFENAAIETRYSCVPLSWHTEPHGLKDRSALYVKNAVELLADAAERALVKAGLEHHDIDAVVSVSTSGIATPSLDALVGERLSLRADVERAPLFGLGCAGGVLGLARSGQMAISRPGSNVLLLVVELCGLTFRPNDGSKANVIATALFGDGAAAAVLSSDTEAALEAPVLGAWGEHTWPGTLDVMGWNVEDDGLGVLFSQNIPSIVRRDYMAALERFLIANHLEIGDIDGFAVHPGGAKVVDALEASLGLAPGYLIESRAVLRDFGNMSAATVFFVLERVLAGAEKPKRILASSLGPGFSAGFVVFEQT